MSSAKANEEDGEDGISDERFAHEAEMDIGDGFKAYGYDERVWPFLCDLCCVEGRMLTRTWLHIHKLVSHPVEYVGSPHFRRYLAVRPPPPQPPKLPVAVEVVSLSPPTHGRRLDSTSSASTSDTVFESAAPLPGESPQNQSAASDTNERTLHASERESSCSDTSSSELHVSTGSSSTDSDLSDAPQRPSAAEDEDADYVAFDTLASSKKRRRDDDESGGAALVGKRPRGAEEEDALSLAVDAAVDADSAAERTDDEWFDCRSPGTVTAAADATADEDTRTPIAAEGSSQQTLEEPPQEAAPNDSFASIDDTFRSLAEVRSPVYACSPAPATPIAPPADPPAVQLDPAVAAAPPPTTAVAAAPPPTTDDVACASAEPPRPDPVVSPPEEGELREPVGAALPPAAELSAAIGAAVGEYRQLLGDALPLTPPTQRLPQRRRVVRAAPASKHDTSTSGALLKMKVNSTVTKVLASSASWNNWNVKATAASASASIKRAAAPPPPPPVRQAPPVESFSVRYRHPKANSDERVLMYRNRFVDDQLHCLTFKATRGAHQALGTAPRSLPTKDEAPRFKDRKRFKNYLGWSSAAEKRNLEDADRYRNKDRFGTRCRSGYAYDFRMNKIQISKKKFAVPFVKHHLHLLLRKSYCGEAAVSMENILKRQPAAESSSGALGSWTRLVVANVGYRRRQFEKRLLGDLPRSRLVSDMRATERRRFGGGLLRRRSRSPVVAPKRSKSAAPRRRAPSSGSESDLSPASRGRFVRETLQAPSDARASIADAVTAGRESRQRHRSERRAPQRSRRRGRSSDQSACSSPPPPPLESLHAPAPAPPAHLLLMRGIEQAKTAADARRPNLTPIDQGSVAADFLSSFDPRAPSPASTLSVTARLGPTPPQQSRRVVVSEAADMAPPAALSRRVLMAPDGERPTDPRLRGRSQVEQAYAKAQRQLGVAPAASAASASAAPEYTQLQPASAHCYQQYVPNGDLSRQNVRYHPYNAAYQQPQYSQAEQYSQQQYYMQQYAAWQHQQQQYWAMNPAAYHPSHQHPSAAQR